LLPFHSRRSPDLPSTDATTSVVQFALGTKFATVPLAKGRFCFPCRGLRHASLLCTGISLRSPHLPSTDATTSDVQFALGTKFATVPRAQGRFCFPCRGLRHASLLCTGIFLSTPQLPSTDATTSDVQFALGTKFATVPRAQG